jgi:hypothetical protein
VKYMLLIYVDPARAPENDLDDWWKVDGEMKEAGVHVAGDTLQPTTTATTVRRNGSGDPTLTDGPFAETKELLGGYYVVDVPDLDEATKWAAKLPNSAYGSTEVRALVEFER